MTEFILFSSNILYMAYLKLFSVIVNSQIQVRWLIVYTYHSVLSCLSSVLVQQTPDAHNARWRIISLDRIPFSFSNFFLKLMEKLIFVSIDPTIPRNTFTFIKKLYIKVF